MSLLKKIFRKIWQENSGAEIAEAAFVLPLLFLLIFAILWFGRAYSIYTTLTRAANAAAQAGASSTCATCTNQFMTFAEVQTNIVNPILVAAHLDPTQANFNMSAANTALNTTNPGNAPVVDGTIITLSYPYGFKLSGVTTGITITAHAEALQEN